MMADLSITDRVADIIGRSRPYLERPREVAERIVATLAEAAGDPEALATAFDAAALSAKSADESAWWMPRGASKSAGIQAVAAAAVAGVREREVDPLLRLLSLPVERRAEVVDAVRAALGGGDRG